MVIGERIKLLRKHLNLTQAEFSDKLGLSHNAIARYENGSRTPMEQTIKSICREFNVSYAWLVEGIEPMFSETDNTTMLIDRILAGENETAKSVFKAFARLSESDWQIVEKIIDSINEQKNKASE